MIIIPVKLNAATENIPNIIAIINPIFWPAYLKYIYGLYKYGLDYELNTHASYPNGQLIKVKIRRQTAENPMPNKPI